MLDKKTSPTSYVLHHKEVVEPKVRADLVYIVRCLREKYGHNLVSVLLCGGYGRGEGSVIKKSNGKYVPYNDYDLFLVTKRRVSQHDLQDLGAKMAEEIGIRFVDLSSIARKNIFKLPQTVFVHDLQMSQVLYGEDVRSLIPVINPRKLPLEEAKTLLRNRLICFFELTPKEFFVGREFKELQHRKMMLQLSKAVIAAHCASLIQANNYTSSYASQMAFTTSPLVQNAYRIKLGDLDPVSIDPYTFWFDAREFYVRRYERLVCKSEEEKRNFISINTFVFHIKKWIKRSVFHEQVVNPSLLRRIEHVTYLMILAHQADNDAYDKALAELRLLLNTALDSGHYYSLVEITSELWERYHH